MAALIVAILVASVLGSLHCAGMCGAFLAFALSDPGGAPVSRVRLQFAYHLGRLLTYMALGSIFGGLGAALDASGTMVGIQQAAVFVAGIVIAGFGSITLLRLAGVKTGRSHGPSWMRQAVAWGHQRAMDLPVQRRAVAIGLLTGLLPCGWLWAFVATAAGTGNALNGAVAMAAFWAGTLPVMVSLGAGVQRAGGWLGRRMPIVTAMALVVSGLWAAGGRWALAGTGIHTSMTRVAGTSAIEQVNDLKSSESSCCAHAR